MKPIFIYLVTLIVISTASKGDDNLNLFEIGKSQFQKYLDIKLAEIITKSNNSRVAAAPFALLHEGRTKYSVLLIHGLNDSPYYMKDIAQLLFDQGYNVITLLLEGHATSFEDMKSVEHTQWVESLHWGLGTAKQLGENVLVGGFSTGGVLSVYAALETSDVKGLLLLAPALAVHDGNSGNRYGAWSCLLSWRARTTAVVDSPIKYKEHSMNSYCQLMHLISDTYEKAGANAISKFTTSDSDTEKSIIKIAEKINVPTFVAMTSIDGRVPFDKLMLFYTRLKVSKRGIIFTPNRNELPETDNLTIEDNFSLKHGFMPLKENHYNKEFNEKFNSLENSIKSFLAHNFN
ncbi:MAG: hypothetical protein A4S09_03460 [Proteobacteria bacterium SG_bin7]|nr:MAG: hypothetical protein A4S09_03460 [Proteobacteria bacterium SG_bin7]